MSCTTYSKALQDQLEEIAFDSDDVAGPDAVCSFCANSDLFAHGLRDAPRDLPDDAYQRQADFFAKPLRL